MLEKPKILPLAYYENVAIRAIKYYCKKKNLPFKPFLSEDYIAEAMNGLIKADINYDSRHDTSLKTFRYRGVVLALLNLKRRKKQVWTVSLNGNESNSKIERSELEKNEDAEFVRNILDKTPMDSQRKRFIELHYYDKKSFADIARMFCSSRQNVQQSIERGIVQMRKYVDHNGISL